MSYRPAEHATVDATKWTTIVSTDGKSQRTAIRSAVETTIEPTKRATIESAE